MIEPGGANAVSGISSAVKWVTGAPPARSIRRPIPDESRTPCAWPRTAKSLLAYVERNHLGGVNIDDEQKSPWYVYRDGTAFVQGWYNDLAAWKAKLDWIDEQHQHYWGER